jgi:hypothetical protein
MAKKPAPAPAKKQAAKSVPAPAKKLCNKLADAPAEKTTDDSEMAEDDAEEMADGEGADAGGDEGDAGGCDCGGADGGAKDDGDGNALADDEPADDAEAPADAPKKQSAKTEGQRFLSAFGKMGGVWYAEGKTFAQAQALHFKALEESNKKLAADNAKLRKQVDVGLGDKEGLSFSGAKDDKEAAKPGLNLSAGLSKFASSIKLPGKSPAK